MLALVSAEGAQLDAGSVGLAVARRWSDSGEGVLFVDADAAGSGLAQRLGEADRAEYSPAVRGLPSLMVAREPVTLRLLADHCYSLDTAQGSLWALLAPSHPAGARRAGAWLGESAAGLRAVDVERRVVVSSSLPAAADPVVALLRAARIVAVLAPVESADAAKALWRACRGAGLHGFDRGLRVLVVEGDSPLGDDDLRAETGMLVAGRLPVVADDRLLRLQGGRRDRAFIKSLDRISSRLLEASRIDAAQGAGPGRGREPAAEAPAQPEPARHLQALSAGSVPAGSVSAGEAPGSVLSGSAVPGSVPAGSVPVGEAPGSVLSSGSVVAGSVAAGSVAAGSVPVGEAPGSVLSSGSVVAGSVPVGEAPGSVPAREGPGPVPGSGAGPQEQSSAGGASGRRAGERGRESSGRRRRGRRRGL